MSLRVVLLTGNGRRHRYATAELARAFDLAGVLVEAKPEAIREPAALPPGDVETMRAHLAARDAVEARLLGDPACPPTERIEVPTGGANSAEAYEWVQGLAPDFVLLYGTSIIRAPLLDAYEGRMVNMHLGLSPYYRGAATNFWPLVEGEPECVGVTIHLAVSKVDAGAMLAQVRPEMDARDGAHEIGTRAIMAGVGAMKRVLPEYAAGRVAPRAQDLTRGRVFRRADFRASAVRTMGENFNGGMIPRYLNDRACRDAAYPILD